MLRRLFISAALIMGLLVGTLANASLEVGDSSDGGVCSSLIPLDHPVPWPWGLEQPFPWGDIQGLWQVADMDINSYFALKVVHEKSTGEKQLVVKQIDPDTCRVIATGVGYELSRVVRAQMTSIETGAIYRLALRAFREEDSPRPVIGKVAISQVMVLSLMDLDSKSESVPVHVQIGKMSASVDVKTCTDEKNK